MTATTPPEAFYLHCYSLTQPTTTGPNPSYGAMGTRTLCASCADAGSDCSPYAFTTRVVRVPAWQIPPGDCCDGCGAVPPSAADAAEDALA